MNTLTFIVIILFYFNRKKRERRVGYFLIQTLASIIIIISLLPPISKTWLTPFGIIFFISIIVKLGVGPLHSWIVRVRLKISWMALLLFLTIQKLLPIIFLELGKLEINTFLLYFCIITNTLGRYSNMVSNSIKKILLFSRISNISWILIAISLSRKIWKIFITVYFFRIYLIIRQPLKNRIRNPTKLNILFWLRVRGIPPFIGFFPKIIIIILLTKLIIRRILIFLLLISLFDLFTYIRQNFRRMLKNPPFNKKLINKTPIFFHITWWRINVLGARLFFL